ncbi:hypothetical protein NDI76_15295 [Halogeometricum sp. S1BR25-6]|uniref:Uncharacterized protein n=1 Tax=Halogeometricum salsisoli TaxID=2950536 RepID=A0ABU2GH33_9EURY|nr:hypothetical protein [Halogeometricum sp. S1BR25-6]MDS0300110.1 hypothetical protein [Halogeometricum sp. S1BR25-6]
MPELLPTAAAALVVLLFAAALALMASGDLRAAAFCFLGASLIIYFRETYLLDD